MNDETNYFLSKNDFQCFFIMILQNVIVLFAKMCFWIWIE